MIVGRAFLIFYVTVAIQLISSITSGLIDGECHTHFDLCYPKSSKPFCATNLECRRWYDSRYRSLCKPDYNWDDDHCEKVPDKVCLDNADCKTIDYSECSENQICSCKSNYIKVAPNKCQGFIKAPCTKNHECFPEHSICVDGFCECKCGYLSPTNDRCLPTFFELTCKADDERCKDDEFSGCLNGKCYCHENHVVVNNAICTPLLNENCARNGLCAVEHSICDNMKCQCKRGYTELSNNRCLPTEVRGHCKVDDDCRFIDNTECSKYGYCECKTDYFLFNATTCAIVIDGKCRTNADCLIENSICLNGLCKCKISFQNVFKERCEPGLHRPCNSDLDCADETFTKCSEKGTCECQENYVASEHDKSCLPLLISFCNTDGDCVTENSYCVYNRCQCKKTYSPMISDGKYSCIKMVLGSSCKTNANSCKAFKNSVCSPNGKCICPANYYAREDKTGCLPSIGGSCSKDEDCQFENSHCFNEKCQCKPEYTAVSENQCTIKSSAVHCNRAIECGEPWHAECSPDYYCYCKTNNTLVNRSTCSPLLDGPCFNIHQCVVENSNCIDFRCKCESQFTAVANNLCVANSLVTM